jgi:hypothetical protein
MDVTPTRTRGPVTVRFEDGLGRRHYADGNAGEPLEILVLRDQLAAAPGFKEALRQQVERLASLRHGSLGYARSVARLIKSEAAIAVISDRVPGMRLSDVLDVAGKEQCPIDMRTALWLTGQLVSAVAALHRHGPDVFHGAIAPDRIIITSGARLVVVEQVLGPAMSQLRLSPSQYWTQYGIALPAGTDGAALDQRSDVMQIGAVALALVLGHALGDNFPVRVGGSADGTAPLSVPAALELLPDEVATWLSRALQLAAEEPFASAVEALEEFNRLLKGVDQIGCSDRFRVFMAAQDREDATPAASAPPSPAARDNSSIEAPTRWPAAERDAIDEQPSDESTEADSMFGASVHQLVGARRLAFGRQRMIAAAAILVLIASGTTVAARRYFRAPVAPARVTGTLVVNTNPPGIRIAVDGEERGVSPLRLDLNPGNHLVDIITEGERRSIPVTIRAGGEMAQFIEAPRQAAAVPTGQLQIRTEPSGARISVDGQPRGTSPATIDGLMPGVHKVAVEGPLGSITEAVTIQAGAVASLVVPLNAAQGVPVSGWVAVSAPAEVQLYEDGRLLGSSRTERIMAAVGRHELEIVNDALGFRLTRTVMVTAGRVTPIAVDWPSGSIALNALPWANVWIDGQLIGETPVGSLPLPIGPHAVVFRHPELGEQHFDAVVTLKGPARLSADLRRK